MNDEVVMKIHSFEDKGDGHCKVCDLPEQDTYEPRYSWHEQFIGATMQPEG